VSPHGVPMVWYEVPTEPPEEVPWSSPLVDEVVAVVHKVLDERDARGAPARAARNGQ